MDRKIKLIWDFKGIDVLEMAKHHCIHLKEFIVIESLSFYEVDFQLFDRFHAIAFVIVDESDLKVFRDALKPHRGELV